jgi:hypothetical protein
MWQRLSGLDKLQFAACVVVMWAGFVAVIAFAMQEQWAATAILTGVMLHPVPLLIKVLKRS